MALIDSNRNPTNRQLRQFGALCAVALPGVAWLAAAGASLIGIALGLGVLVAVLAVMVPRTVAPLFVAAMLLTRPLAMLLGELCMLTIYGVIFLPMGILFRLLGRDRLRLKWERHASSYWQTKTKPKSVASYYRQS